VSRIDQLTASKEVGYHYSRLPEIRPGAGRVYNKWGDFDNGISTWQDGAYINKPDEGSLGSANSQYTYFSWDASQSLSNEGFFSPNRLVPSPGMLGSLPISPVTGATPWATFLFRPDPITTGPKVHPGSAKPKDHLWMDLFWVPYVEPYPISEPFSSSGKLNLNYEVAPFSYIRRATGIYGVMKSEEPLLLPNEIASSYKLWDHETNDWPKYPNNKDCRDSEVRTLWGMLFNGTPPYDKLRRPLNMSDILSQFDKRFSSGDIFRSATEICDIHLVREGERPEQYEGGDIWTKNLITGDNTRERPYTNIYSKITTRSNTYNVHYRVQVLEQAGGQKDSDWLYWDENRSSPLAEYRGSTLFERYIDPADRTLPDFANTPGEIVPTADRYYRIRQLSTKKFVP
jgi:uncharacterized protein (TIGR02600 family)